MIDDTGDLVSCGDLGLGGADTGFQAAIEGAEGAVATGHRSGSLQESLAGAVVALAGGGADDLAAGDLVVGGPPEPGAEVFFGRELAHVGADFADDLLRQVETEAIHRGEVNAGEAAQALTDTDGGLSRQILAVGMALVGRKRVGVVGSRIGPRGTNGAVGPLNLGVAGCERAGVAVVELEGLLEDKEVFCAPGAGQGLSNFGCAFPALRAAQGGQPVRVALASDDGANDAQAGVAGRVRDRLIEPDVHVDESLLHVQDVG